MDVEILVKDYLLCQLVEIIRRDYFSVSLASIE